MAIVHSPCDVHMPLPRLTCVSAAVNKHNLTVFPPFDSHDSDSSKHDSPFEAVIQQSDQMTMAGSPYIKPEPNDFHFDPNHYNQYPNNHQMNPSFNTNGAMNINPANLTNGNGMQQTYGQSMGNSFNVGNSGIADDELLDLDFPGPNQNQQQQNGFNDFNSGVNNFIMSSQQQQAHQNAIFSHTPDGAPIQSPFVNNDFNYSNFRPAGQQFGVRSMPNQGGSFRPQAQSMARKISETRSPNTPLTPSMNIQQAEDFHPGMQPIQHQRQQGSVGNGWDSTPSGHSWGDSTSYPSPGSIPMHHPQISEVLKGNAHHHKATSSLPTKIEPMSGPVNTTEAKRRRRRESHNMVERRRRDNINERIQDLGTLVPQHRLEDEKVRKHLQTNAPLSPSIANAGLSPPAAPSLLVGSQGRRAGSITTGLPLEDKDKGPNKGDILNGCVAWNRDLMWFLHKKMAQMEELKERLGTQWPYEEPDEEERRMYSEICEVLNKHAPAGGFGGYSRSRGSGLRVPGFTNVAGEPLDSNGHAPVSFDLPQQPPQQDISPGFQAGGSGDSSGQMSHQQNQFWGSEFKEEDEYGMELQ